LFRPTLEGPPFDLQIEDDHGCLAISVEIASSGDRIVVVVCELTDLDQPYAEFSFSIAVVSLDQTHEEFQTQDRQIAAPFIPDGVRPSVMRVVCSCLDAMVKRAKPLGVYRVVKEPNAHEKALKKHEMLTEVLENTGYFVEDQGTDPFDRRFCTMRRNPD